MIEILVPVISNLPYMCAYQKAKRLSGKTVIQICTLQRHGLTRIVPFQGEINEFHVHFMNEL